MTHPLLCALPITTRPPPWNSGRLKRRYRRFATYIDELAVPFQNDARITVADVYRPVARFHARGSGNLRSPQTKVAKGRKPGLAIACSSPPCPGTTPTTATFSPTSSSRFPWVQDVPRIVGMLLRIHWPNTLAQLESPSGFKHAVHRCARIMNLPVPVTEAGSHESISVAPGNAQYSSAAEQGRSTATGAPPLSTSNVHGLAATQISQRPAPFRTHRVSGSTSVRRMHCRSQNESSSANTASSRLGHPMLHRRWHLLTSHI